MTGISEKRRGSAGFWKMLPYQLLTWFQAFLILNKGLGLDFIWNLTWFQVFLPLWIDITVYTAAGIIEASRGESSGNDKTTGK